MTLQDELRAVLNRYSAENGSNTPDFVLAEYLLNCLNAFDLAVTAREAWYDEGRPNPPMAEEWSGEEAEETDETPWNHIHD